MTIDSDKKIRVRMAPSPTGLLHFGTARTALFNFLFSRHHHGVFVLRIEDTDRERSKKEYEDDIINGLKWLGIEWDEGPDVGGDFGPYRQSERLSIYKKYLERLLEENNAYHCFCSKEELEADRQAMLSQGLAPKYSGKCRGISREESQSRLDRGGEPSVIRLKTPEIVVDFHDLIRGKISTDLSLVGDFVIARNLEQPLFIFAGAIDDYEMKITHVIRGEDHISNTPKQIIIQKILGLDEVKYAHLPLILAPDRTKLSKRYLETSLTEFKNLGYFPEALVNFISFLGWHPREEKEILSREDLIKEFDIKRVQKAGAIFNMEKLEWFNSQYIKMFDEEKILEALFNFIPAFWTENKDKIIKIITIEKERMKTLKDFSGLSNFFFELPEYAAELLIWDKMSLADVKEKLKLAREKTDGVAPADFNKKFLEDAIMPLTEIYGRGEVLWPLRVALSGQKASPGPFEIMEILGKEESLKRLDIAVRK